MLTGEEDERNVLQMNAKLHVFDKSSLGGGSWAERGRGLLRLNDYVDEEDGAAKRRRRRARRNNNGEGRRAEDGEEQEEVAVRSESF